MIDQIIQWDQNLFLFLNSINSTSIDPIMNFISKSYIPGILILLFLFIYGFKKFNKGVMIAFFCAILTIAISDGVSSKVFKPTFKRLRPCHDPNIQAKVYLAGNKCWGGKYGFVSSHAANTFAIAMFIFLLFFPYTKGTFILFIWAVLVSYSRIYLAKHYPLDLICGGLLGMIAGYISYKIFKFIFSKSGWSSLSRL